MSLVTHTLRKAFTADEKEAFEKGFGIVSALAEKLVTSSCNLKAHMHCFPQPYLLQSKIIDKLDFMSGFGAYSKAIVGEEKSVYRITRGDVIIYPLRQMLSLLLHGYISVISPIPDALSIVYDKTFYPLSKQKESALIVATQKNSIYDEYELTEHTLNLVKDILNLCDGYYRPLLNYYSACYELKKGNKEQATHKLLYEIERLKEIDVPLSLLPKILFNHITGQSNYDLKGDYDKLLEEVCDSSKQVFYKTNYIYDYIDIKKLELSINPNRISFFKEYEAKMDVETRSRLKSVEDALFAGLRSK